MVCLAALLSVDRLDAQSENAIHGTVTDASGAVIAGAKVTITNNLTGVQSPAVSSSEGTAQFTTDAFQDTGPWQIGDSPRAYAALRSPPMRIENFDLIKSFQFNEHLRAVQAPDNNSLDSTFGKSST
jgi:hypothetical protein